MSSAAGEEVKVASSFRQALGSLRQQEFSAVIIDEALECIEPQQSTVVLQHLGPAVPVYLNFGVTGIERAVRELRISLRRRQIESAAARRSAEQALRSQLRSKLTALLLSCELALETKGLPAAAETRIRSALQLARELRHTLSAH
jgi:hypothetical protein